MVRCARAYDPGKGPGVLAFSCQSDRTRSSSSLLGFDISPLARNHHPARRPPQVPEHDLALSISTARTLSCSPESPLCRSAVKRRTGSFKPSETAQCGIVVRGKLQGLFESRCSFFVITLLKVGTASGCVVLRVFGSESEHPIIISHRLIEFVDTFVGLSSTLKCTRASRIELDCFAQICDRFLEFADFIVISPAVVIGVSKLWPQLDCRSRVANCQVVLASPAVNDGAVVIGSRIFRIELNRRSPITQSFIKLSFFGISCRAVKINIASDVLVRVRLQSSSKE
jgi:hypothetical protein